MFSKRKHEPNTHEEKLSKRNKKNITPFAINRNWHVELEEYLRVRRKFVQLRSIGISGHNEYLYHSIKTFLFHHTYPVVFRRLKDIYPTMSQFPYCIVSFKKFSQDENIQLISDQNDDAEILDKYDEYKYETKYIMKDSDAYLKYDDICERMEQIHDEIDDMDDLSNLEEDDRKFYKLYYEFHQVADRIIYKLEKELSKIRFHLLSRSPQRIKDCLLHCKVKDSEYKEFEFVQDLTCIKQKVEEIMALIDPLDKTDPDYLGDDHLREIGTRNHYQKEHDVHQIRINLDIHFETKQLDILLDDTNKDQHAYFWTDFGVIYCKHLERLNFYFGKDIYMLFDEQPYHEYLSSLILGISFMKQLRTLQLPNFYIDLDSIYETKKNDDSINKDRIEIAIGFVYNLIIKNLFKRNKTLCTIIIPFTFRINRGVLYIRKEFRRRNDN